MLTVLSYLIVVVFNKMKAESIVITTAAGLSALGSLSMMLAIYKIDRVKLFA